MMLSRTHDSNILIISLAGVIGSLWYLALALTYINSSTHSGHFSNVFEVDYVPLTNLEHSKSISRLGDAKFLSNLEINSEYENPDKSCHLCTKIVYTPAKERYAAIAYGGDIMDLTGSKRLVFFAMGTEGGEELSVLVAGKRINTVSKSSENTYTDIFPSIQFVDIEKVTLSQHWTRYELSIEGINLRDILYPIGLMVKADNSSQAKAFYLKGITIDNKPSKNPL